MSVLFLAALGYMLAQFAVGAWVSRRIRTEDDYLVAGRRMGYRLTTFSFFATWFGAETCMGAAGEVYTRGINPASAEPFGYGLCLLLLGVVFAVPLWNRKLSTLADLFRQRYSPGVERFAAVVLIPSSLLWAAAQMRAFGQVLTVHSVFEIQVTVTLAAGCVIAYTLLGGLLADAITDLIQGIVLAFGLVVLLVALVEQMGGVAGTVDAVRASGLVRPTMEGTRLQVLESWAVPVLGSVTAAELIPRVAGARSAMVARRSALGAGTLYMVLGLIPVLVGLLGSRLVPDLADPETLLPLLAGKILPTALAVVFTGALISAMLSTVDSTLLTAASLLSHNLLVPAFRVGGERQKVRLARAGVAVLGGAAYLLALRADGVYALVEEASSFGTAGGLVAVVFGLFTRWGGRGAAYAGLSAGLLGYLAATAAAASTPFLVSLAASVAAYALGSLFESTRGGGRGATPAGVGRNP